MLSIAVLVSGGGTNLQALLDAQCAGELHSGCVELVISNRKNAYALERARQNGIATEVISKAMYPEAQAFDAALLEALRRHGIDVVVLAGYLSIIGPQVLSAYEDRILNVHPSLIPAFCGEGYYGLRVHEQALARGVKVTGATVHLVNEITDGGRILAQKAVEVQEGDTPETLQRRVMEQAEWVLLPACTERLCAQLAAKK